MEEKLYEEIKILIIVRSGQKSIHRSWSYTSRNYADVAVSVYDEADWSGKDVKFLHRAQGGKFQGIKNFFEKFPYLIQDYDYFWLFEDDLVLPHTSLVNTYHLLCKYRFLLAAPALTYESYFSWPMAVQNDQMKFRGTDFVEIMAPIMSRTFLEMAMPHFDENTTGFGYEWLWRELLEQKKTFAVLLDSAPIVHTRPQGEGNLYRGENLGGLTRQDEFDIFIKKFNLNTSLPFKNLFGITCGPNEKLVFGKTMIRSMLAGYSNLLLVDDHSVFRCINELLNTNRPVLGLEQLRLLSGFSEIEITLC